MKRARFAKCLALFLAVSLAIPSLGSATSLSYDVSGAPGQRDEDGRPSYRAGDTAGWGGQNGADGGHARELSQNGRLLKKGWDGGKLNLTLSSPDGRNVQVQGTKVLPEQTNRVGVSDSIPLISSSSLLLDASGGAGGGGGDGGRGQDGGKGSTGTPANRIFPGGPGGRGGTGGDEGDSTDGGDAGAGGEIVVRVPIQDTDLAMLIDQNSVNGNHGGPAGQGQGAGQGGEGGDGGAPHEWYTTETRRVQRSRDEDYQSGTDTDGNAIMSTRTITWEEDESYEESHYMPGGPDGPDGSSGRLSSRRVSDGRDSKSGQFTFEVKDQQGNVKRYPSWYRLELEPGYTLTGSHNNNGFYEPGETITLQNLTVTNVGGSPTPEFQPVKLFINDNDRWIVSNGEELKLPKVLAPGDSFTFKESISFHLREKDRTVEGLLREKDVVRPRSRVTRVEREFTAFADGAETQVHVQYPIEITPLESLASVAPGEAQMVMFRIKNISQQTIGQYSSNETLRFAHSVFRRTKGSTGEGDFVISASKNGGAVSPKEGIERAIEGLKPGEEIIVTTYVGFQEGADLYSEVNIQPELFLQSILDPKNIRLIHYEPYKLRVATAFKYQPDADVLLIANHDLDKAALEALRTTAAVKQLKMDIWDFSYYGFFNFSHDVADYGAIFEAYRGRTLMLLGNPVRYTTEGHKIRPQNLISPDTVIEAARRYGIKIVVLDTSEDSTQTVERLIEPLPMDAKAEGSAADVREHASPREYLKNLSKTIHEVQEDQGDAYSFLGVDRITLKKTPLWPWTEPSEEMVKSAGLKTLLGTESYVPESQAFADYDFNPQLMGTTLLWRHWRLGHLNVRRSVDDSKTTVVAINIPKAHFEDPNFILSDQFQTAFDLSLNFILKLKLLNSILLGEFGKNMNLAEVPAPLADRVRDPLVFARVLIHSLMLDLIHEQLTIRPDQHLSRVPQREIWNKLDYMKKLTEFNYTQLKLDPASKEGELFIDFVTSLRFFNYAILSNLQKFLYQKSSKSYQISVVTKQMLKRVNSLVFADVPAAEKLIEEKLAIKRKEARELKVSRAQVVNFLDPDGLRNSSVRDGDVFRDPNRRLRSVERQQDLKTAEAARALKAQEVQASIEKDNARLRLTAEDCRQLLESARPAQKDLLHVPFIVDRAEPVPVAR